MSHKSDEGQYGGYSLGDESCPGDAGNAHIELGHKYPVKYHVENRGEYKKIKRYPRFSEGVEHGRKNIIHKKKGKPEKIYVQIFYSHVKNIGGSVEQRKYLPAEHQSESAEKKAYEKKNSKGRIDRRFHFFKPFRPEIPAYDHGRTYSSAYGNAYKYIRKRIGRSDGRQGAFSHISADDGRIRHCVCLLKKIPYDYRQRKIYQNAHRIFFR